MLAVYFFFVSLQQGFWLAGGSRFLQSYSVQSIKVGQAFFCYFVYCNC